MRANGLVALIISSLLILARCATPHPVLWGITESLAGLFLMEFAGSAVQNQMEHRLLRQDYLSTVITVIGLAMQAITYLITNALHARRQCAQSDNTAVHAGVILTRSVNSAATSLKIQNTSSLECRLTIRHVYGCAAQATFGMKQGVCHAPRTWIASLASTLCLALRNLMQSAFLVRISPMPLSSWTPYIHWTAADVTGHATQDTTRQIRLACRATARFALLAATVSTAPSTAAKTQRVCAVKETRATRLISQG